MKDAKIRAIRSAIIGLSDNCVKKIIEKAGTDKIKELAECVIENGTDNTKLFNSVRSKFIDFVDAHTTILRTNIRNVVMNAERDFVVEDWNVIFADLFPTTPLYDDVVYALVSEVHEDCTTEIETILYKTWDNALLSFNGCKRDAETFMENHADEYEVEVDNDTQYQAQDNYWETYVDVNITKKVLF